MDYWWVNRLNEVVELEAGSGMCVSYWVISSTMCVGGGKYTIEIVSQYGYRNKRHISNK